MKNLKDFFLEKETYISIFMAIILLAISYKINMYENINQYMEAFKNIAIYIASGLLAMIGIILTGIALILGLLDKNLRKIIKQADENGVDDIIGDFKKITINIGIGSMIYFITYISLFSQIYITKLIFYTVFSILSWYFIYLLLYVIILISNTLELFKIKNIDEEQEKIDKMHIYQYASEIKIEYLAECIINDNNSMINKIMKKNKPKTYKDFVNDLNYRVDIKDGLSKNTKKLIKEYYKNYYNV